MQKARRLEEKRREGRKRGGASSQVTHLVLAGFGRHLAGALVSGKPVWSGRRPPHPPPPPLPRDRELGRSRAITSSHLGWVRLRRTSPSETGAPGRREHPVARSRPGSQPSWSSARLSSGLEVQIKTFRSNSWGVRVCVCVCVCVCVFVGSSTK